MIVHKLLFGDGAATYLPFALSRLRALEALNHGGFFSQTFTSGDATIHVRQVGEQQYLTITMSGGFYFEFATSGFPVTVVSSPPLFAGVFPNYYDSLTVGSTISTQNGSVVTKSVVLQGKRGYTSQIEFNPQIQLLSQPVKYRELEKKLRDKYIYKHGLFSSYSPHNSHTGVGLRVAMMKAHRFWPIADVGGWDNAVLRDIFFDQTWGYNTGFTPLQIAYVQDSADWPRESGFQTVVDPVWGTRDFAIMVDAFQRFHIFPISSIGPQIANWGQNVTAANIRHLSPAYPAWMYTSAVMARDYYTSNPIPIELTMSMPDYDWKFNHTGTKACAVVYARSPFNNDDAYWTSLQNATTPWTQAKFDTVLVPLLHHFAPAEYVYAMDPAFSPQRYFIAPGLVEVSINITLTGPEPNDFSVEVPVTEIRDPNTTLYATYLAGYSWVDLAGQNVAAGDLVVVDMELYGLPTDPSVPHVSVLAMKNLTNGKEVFAVKGQPVLAADLSTCSIVLKAEITDRHVLTATPLRSGGLENIDWIVSKFGVWFIINGQSKELLFPESMDDAGKLAIAEQTNIKGREFLAALYAADPDWEYIPLAHPKDGWNDAAWNNYRDYWSYSKHFWYNETWVMFDPDWTAHGTSYPTGGYVKYRDEPGGFVGPTDPYIENRVLGMHGSVVGSDHLMLCDNPRWGWNIYAGYFQVRNLMHPATTFFTHPNGSYCFYNDALIYAAQGVPNLTIDSAQNQGADALLCNSLSIFDVSTVEHCIFDVVHLEVKNALGVAAQKNTSFLELYNAAVVAGKKAETLADGIDIMTRADLRGKFEKAINPSSLLVGGVVVETLDLKFTWRGRDWYYNEQALMGTWSYEPSIPFGPMAQSGLISLSLYMPWNITPTATSAGLQAPVEQALGVENPNALPIRFANPIIIMG